MAMSMPSSSSTQTLTSAVDTVQHAQLRGIQ
jgi:hypothetical protein